jgi:hypothetical protein
MTTPSIAVALSRVSAKQRKLESAQELVQIASRERAESMQIAVVAGASMIQVGGAAGISRQMVHRILSGDTGNGPLPEREDAAHRPWSCSSLAGSSCAAERLRDGAWIA